MHPSVHKDIFGVSRLLGGIGGQLRELPVSGWEKPSDEPMSFAEIGDLSFGEENPACHVRRSSTRQATPVATCSR
jgi:hypothetical protein